MHIAGQSVCILLCMLYKLLGELSCDKFYESDSDK